MFTDYVNFCTDTLIPTKTVTIEPNSKPWINNKIKKMIDEKCITTTETANASIFSKIKSLEKYTEVNETMFSVFKKIWQKPKKCMD